MHHFFFRPIPPPSDGRQPAPRPVDTKSSRTKATAAGRSNIAVSEALQGRQDLVARARSADLTLRQRVVEKVVGLAVVSCSTCVAPDAAVTDSITGCQVCCDQRAR